MRYAVTRHVWYIVPLCMMIGGVMWFMFVSRIDCVPIFFIDSCINNVEQQRVRLFIAKNKNTQDPAMLINNLHEEFLWLHHVSIAYLSPFFMHIRMHAHEPISTVNNDYLLLPTQRIVDVSVYAFILPYSYEEHGPTLPNGYEGHSAVLTLDQFPAIVVDDAIITSGVCPQDYVEQIVLFDDGVHQSFIVDLCDQQQIYLRDRVDKNCSLLCSWQQKIDQQIVVAYEKVKNIITISAHEHKVFDVRFDDQIIVYKNDKGGAYVT